MKCCSKCKFICNDEDISQYFSRDKSQKTGFRSACKDCCAQSFSKYYETHKDVLQAKHIIWKNNNREHISQYNKDYASEHFEILHDKQLVRYWNDPERFRRGARAYWQKNKETISVKSKRYYRINTLLISIKRRARYASDPQRWRKATKDFRNAHPEVAINYNATRRALLKGAPIIENVDRLVIYERDGGKCHLCHRKCSKKAFTLDHLIPLSKGGNHTAENLAIAHRSCNSRRGAGRTPAQLRLIG